MALPARNGNDPGVEQTPDRDTIEPVAAAPDNPRTLYRGTLAGDGRPGPIEKRVGRRLLELIDPDSVEGRRLLEGARVQWLGPDGEALGTLSQNQALACLARRLERQLDGVSAEADRHAIEDGLARVRERSARLSNGH